MLLIIFFRLLIIFTTSSLVFSNRIVGAAEMNKNAGSLKEFALKITDTLPLK